MRTSCLTPPTLLERRFYVNELPRYAGCESLDDIAKDHVTHTDRRADGSGQNKVDTDDRQHVCSLGNEIPYMSGIHTNVTTVQLPSDKPGTVTFGTSPKTGEMAPLMCDGAVCGSQFRAGGKAGSGQ